MEKAITVKHLIEAFSAIACVVYCCVTASERRPETGTNRNAGRRDGVAGSGFDKVPHGIHSRFYMKFMCAKHMR